MDEVLVERRSGWHRITLNRPDRLNAFDPAMHEALRAALEAAEADKACRAVLLTGAGRGFCAGQDLDAVPSGPDADLGQTIDQHYNPLIRRLRALSIPIVCAVNGVAAGAGANLALACDIVLAARSAKFIQAFVKIGLVPDTGGSFFLPQLIGDARARALAMLGEAVPADRAEHWGMIWRAVDDAALMDEAEAVVAQLVAAPSGALAQIKRMLAHAADSSLDGQLELERDEQRAAGRSADYAEGVRAFREKRPPRFGPRT
jgi:2-(1,2-epoxy-1,2-dihydrophenyl)acetyl-CoA isomerase